MLAFVWLVVLATTAVAQDSIQVRMQAWSKALGVECAHCHTPDRWDDSSKPLYSFAQRMMRMVEGLNEGPLKDLGVVTCWTCHRGQAIPARLARESWERLRADHAAEFESRPNQAVAMSVYAASLGVDCSHCHEAVKTENSKAPKAMVARMLPIFEEIPKYFDDSRKPVTQCFMCHHGKPKPEPAPR